MIETSNSSRDKIPSTVIICMRRRSGLYLTGYYDGGSGPIWLDDPQCTGSERSLAECGHARFGVVGSSCSHDDDVTIICDNSKC